MPVTLHRYFPMLFLMLPLWALCLGGNVALAQEQQITVLRHGVSTPLTLPEYKSQGTGYASMHDIARQLGASVVVKEAQVAFRLDGQVAEIGLNDMEVHTDRLRFSLGHPVLAYESDALIAMSDVIPFLRGAFEFGTPEAPPTTSALGRPRDTSNTAPDEDLEETMESDVLEVVSAPPLPIEEAPTDLEAIEITASTKDTQPSTSRGTSPFSDRSSFLLAIDPGHGGEDPGVVGPNGLLEKELCLTVASSLRRALKEQYGIATIMTRDKDESMSPAARLNRATTAGATLILSIHGGASNAPEARGYQLFSHKRKRSLSGDPKHALEAARRVSHALDQATSQPPRPVREVPLLLARGDAIPCILVELGNLTHSDDEKKLTATTYQEMLATALAKGIDAAIDTRNSP